jgi:hypothetical protein
MVRPAINITVKGFVVLVLVLMLVLVLFRFVVVSLVKVRFGEVLLALENFSLGFEPFPLNQVGFYSFLFLIFESVNVLCFQ